MAARGTFLAAIIPFLAVRGPLLVEKVSLFDCEVFLAAKGGAFLAGKTPLLAARGSSAEPNRGRFLSTRGVEGGVKNTLQPKKGPLQPLFERGRCVEFAGRLSCRQKGRGRLAAKKGARSFFVQLGCKFRMRGFHFWLQRALSEATFVEELC